MELPVVVGHTEVEPTLVEAEAASSYKEEAVAVAVVDIDTDGAPAAVAAQVELAASSLFQKDRKTLSLERKVCSSRLLVFIG